MRRYIWCIWKNKQHNTHPQGKSHLKCIRTHAVQDSLLKALLHRHLPSLIDDISGALLPQDEEKHPEEVRS